MALLGFVEDARTGISSAGHNELAGDTAPIKLMLADTIGSGNRLWIRGRVLLASGGVSKNGKSWLPWGRGINPASSLPNLAIQTRVGGAHFSATSPVDPSGRFEFQLAGELAAARRGWRVARHRFSLLEHHVDACNIVLVPPAAAKVAIVVFLPRSCIDGWKGVASLAALEENVHLAELLVSFQDGPASTPIYYVAPTSLPRDFSEVELALAATSIGWPAGTFLLLDCNSANALTEMADVLDRLRWVFAGTLDLVVVNLEEKLRQLPVDLREPPQDWAVVRRLISYPSYRPPTYANGEKRARQARPLRSTLLPRHPVVFCHGMLAFTMLRFRLPNDLNCFSPLRDFFHSQGVRALFPQVPPTSGIIERAKKLRDQICSWTSEPVNLICHSMGGLDARYMISHLGMHGHVRTLTTVCTPHRGTSLADWFSKNFRSRVPLLLAMEALGVNVDGFRDCGVSCCKAFNDNTPDHGNICYFSYGAEVTPSRLSPVLRRAWSILHSSEGPNDGMVSVASARWGEYLGTIHADHFAQTPDAVFVRVGEDFDCLQFYNRMVEDLARRGF
jgi:triacylglycerol esterase/lipase EstA (alpha/beta hydrolase family)